MSDRAALEKAAMLVLMNGSGRITQELWADILKILALIRAEVLEEAARVAENTPHWTDVGKPLGKMPTSRDAIAAAIRALKGGT